MSAIALVILGTVGLAILLAVLMPGAGFIGAIVVAVIGLAVLAWLLAAGASRTAPSDMAGRTEETPELLGSGGPDDPARP